MIWWITQNTLIAALLAAVVVLICRTTRIGPAARHALWLVVLIKLITPPLFNWPWQLPELPQLTYLSEDGVASVSQSDASPAPLKYQAPATFEDPAQFLEPSATEPLYLPAETHIVPRSSAGETTYEIPQANSNSQQLAAEYYLLPTEQLEPAQNQLEGQIIGAETEEASATAIAQQSSAATTSHSVASSWPIDRAQLVNAVVAIYLLGVGLMLFVQTLRIVRMVRLLSRCRKPPTALRRHVATLAKQMNVRPPVIRIAKISGGPMIWSLGGARLIWPAHLLDETKFSLENARSRSIIVHELAHLRRRDHWIGWLELAAGCIWWWNPLFWYVRSQLRENAELACDAWVVSILPQGRRAYAEALLTVCEFTTKTAPPMPTLAFGAGARRSFERRLTMIMRERVPSKLSRGAFAALLLLTLFLLPGWSLVGADKEEPAAAPLADIRPLEEPAAAPTINALSDPASQPQDKFNPFDERPSQEKTATQKKDQGRAQKNAVKTDKKKSEKATFSFYQGFDTPERTPAKAVVFSDFGQVEQDDVAKDPTVHPASDKKRLAELEKKLDALTKAIESLQKPAAKRTAPPWIGPRSARKAPNHEIMVYATYPDGRLKIYREGNLFYTVSPNGNTRVTPIPQGKLAIEQYESILKTAGRIEDTAPSYASSPFGERKRLAGQRNTELIAAKEKAALLAQLAEGEKTIARQQKLIPPALNSKAEQIIQTVHGPMRRTVVREARINKKGERVITERAIYVPVNPPASALSPPAPANVPRSVPQQATPNVAPTYAPPSAPKIAPGSRGAGQTLRVSPNQGLRISIPAIGPPLTLPLDATLTLDSGKLLMQKTYEIPITQGKALADLLKMIPVEKITVSPPRGNPLSATQKMTIATSPEAHQVIQSFVNLLKKGQQPPVNALSFPQTQPVPSRRQLVPNPKVKARSKTPIPPKEKVTEKTNNTSSPFETKTKNPGGVGLNQPSATNLSNLPEKVDSFILEELNNKLTPKIQNTQKSPPLNATDDPTSPPIKIEKR